MGEVTIEKTLFVYSINNLLKKDKVRFYYALKGRDGKSGIVKELGIEYLGKAVLLVPRKHEEEVKEFLNYWNLVFSIKKMIVENEKT